PAAPPRRSPAWRSSASRSMRWASPDRRPNRYGPRSRLGIRSLCETDERNAHDDRSLAAGPRPPPRAVALLRPAAEARPGLRRPPRHPPGRRPLLDRPPRPPGRLDRRHPAGELRERPRLRADEGGARAPRQRRPLLARRRRAARPGARRREPPALREGAQDRAG